MPVPILSIRPRKGTPAGQPTTGHNTVVTIDGVAQTHGDSIYVFEKNNLATLNDDTNKGFKSIATVIEKMVKKL